MYRVLASSLAVAVAISLAPGCALAVTGPDPHRPLDEVPRCDTGKAPIVMDGLGATLAGIAGLVAFGGDEGGLGAAMLGIGGLFAASAYKGNREANACTKAFNDYNTLLARRRETQYDAATRSARRQRTPVTPAAPPVATVPDPVEPPGSAEPAVTAEPSSTPPPTVPPPRVPPPNTFGAPRPVTNRPTARRPEPAPVDDDWSQFWKVVP